jgi:hypothetical protein
MILYVASISKGAGPWKIGKREKKKQIKKGNITYPPILNLLWPHV